MVYSQSSSRSWSEVAGSHSGKVFDGEPCSDVFPASMPAHLHTVQSHQPTCYVRPLASPAMGHWGTCPPRIYFFQCTLTYTKSDNDYMLTVVSCKHPLLCPSWHQILATPLRPSLSLPTTLLLSHLPTKVIPYKNQL